MGSQGDGSRNGLLNTMQAIPSSTAGGSQDWLCKTLTFTDCMHTSAFFGFGAFLSMARVLPSSDCHPPMIHTSDTSFTPAVGLMTTVSA